MTKDDLKDTYDERMTKSSRTSYYGDYLNDLEGFNQSARDEISSAPLDKRFDLRIRVFFDTIDKPALDINCETFNQISENIAYADLNDTTYFLYCLSKKIHTILPQQDDFKSSEFMSDAKKRLKSGWEITWHPIGSMEQYGVALAGIAMRDFNSIFSHVLQLLDSSDDAEAYIELIYDIFPVNGIGVFSLFAIGNRNFLEFAKKIAEMHEKTNGCQKSLGTIGSSKKSSQ